MKIATTPKIRKAHATADDGARLEALLAHLERLLPDPAQVPAFRRAMVRPPAVHVRLNRLLPQAARVGRGLRQIAAAVPWCADAFALTDGDSGQTVARSLEYRLGALYIQAAATTLAAAALDPRPGQVVLDLAAAPGGKATQIAAAMANSGVLVANEPRSRRVTALVGNLERCGAHNTVVTSAPGAVLARWFHNAFDRVLLDAPCSGDGVLCKDRHMLAYWSPDDARRKGLEQIGLLRAAFHMLKPGGRLVYSTCSLSTEENEDVLAGLLHRFPGQVELLPLAGVPGGSLSAQEARRYPPALAGGVRVWPHLHDTEGAFAALLGKRGPTRWERVDGDAGPALSFRPHDPDPGNLAGQLAARWGFSPGIPAGHELIANHRHVHLRPAGAAQLAAQLPFFVRAGMRVAGLRADHFFLSQQAVSLWGHGVAPRRLDLAWTQVQSLFAGEPAAARAGALGAGEVVCFHDGWPICRGLLRRDGALEGYVPRAARCPDLVRLCL